MIDLWEERRAWPNLRPVSFTYVRGGSPGALAARQPVHGRWYPKPVATATTIPSAGE